MIFFMLKEDFINQTIKQIVREEIRKQIIVQNVPTYNNPLTLFPFYGLNETLLHSFPVKKVEMYIKDYFKLKNHQTNITKRGDVEILNVYTFLTDIDVDFLNKAMNYLGWFLSTPKIEYVEKMQEKYNKGKIENLYLTLQFEPKHQNNITDEIKETEKTLIHLTPVYYVGKIRNIGFSPRSKNKQFGYTDRVYFLKGSINRDELLNIGERLNYNNENPINKGKYAIITIDTTEIPNYVKLFYDPNFKDGVYTCNNVPPEVIVHIEEIQLTDWTEK